MNAVSTRIVPMSAADLGEVLTLERAAFHDPWTQAHFEGELRNPHAYIDLLRAPDGTLLGYIAYWIIIDEAQILDVAVDPTRRRQGLGRHLVSHVLQTARARACRTITLEARRSNDAAVHLYESVGFKPIAVRKRYYASNGEDAIVMQLALEPDEEDA